jgi:hypothetical protein
MSDAYQNEIYQELYAIRAQLQSMDYRSDMVNILQELRNINKQLTVLTKLVGGPQDSSQPTVEKPKGIFKFMR